MRRLMCMLAMYMVAFVLALAVPLWAQHGGGRASGGHAGFGGARGFSGARGFGGGHMGGGQFLGRGHAGSGASRGFQHSSSSSSFSFSQHFSQPGFSRQPFLHDGWRRNRVRARGFFNRCYGYACPRSYYYPWAYGGYYDPWGWDFGSSYDEDYDRDLARANEMNAQSLYEQRMRRGEYGQDQDQNQNEDADYQGPNYREQNRNMRSAPAPHQSDIALPMTVLVFRDQRKLEIRNYAIVGETLWCFTPQRTQKIPLSELDLDATVKENDDRGLTFRVPGRNEGQ
jgi:hypothetical protein